MKPIAVVDVDHTLADAVWRDHLIGGDGGWDAYHADSHMDEPIAEIVALISCLHAGGWHLVGLTCRPEKWRGQTVQWMTKHRIPIDELIMRPDDDFRSSPVLKPILLRRHLNDDLSMVRLVLDDRGDVASAFVEENITVLQVHAKRKRRWT